MGLCLQSYFFSLWFFIFYALLVNLKLDNSEYLKNLQNQETFTYLLKPWTTKKPSRFFFYNSHTAVTPDCSWMDVQKMQY